MEAYGCFYLREYRDKIVAEMPWKFLQHEAFVLKSTNLVIDRSTAISGWSVSSAVKCCIEFYPSPLFDVNNSTTVTNIAPQKGEERVLCCNFVQYFICTPCIPQCFFSLSTTHLFVLCSSQPTLTVSLSAGYSEHWTLTMPRIVYVKSLELYESR